MKNSTDGIVTNRSGFYIGQRYFEIVLDNCFVIENEATGSATAKLALRVRKL